MKPIELLKLWSDLQAFLPLVPEDKREGVVREIQRSLPPAILSRHPYTYEVVETLIKQELENYGRTNHKPKDRPKELEAKVGSGQRSDSKARKVRTNK